MKKHFIYLFVSLFVLTLATACNEDPATIDNAPEVFVYEAEDVMRTSAVLSGRLVASAQSNVREYGFLVGPTSDLTTAETRSYPIKGSNGEFSVQVVDLEIGTPYFYAVYASNGLEKMLSTVMAFTTPTRSGVLITELQLIDETTATVSARIADNGGGEINAVGFCWGTDEKPTIFTGENCFAPLGEDNTFTASLPLTSGATYSIRAFADSDITGDGTTTISYSQPISITLDEEPVVEDRWAICGTMNDWGDLWMEWNEELGYFVLYDLTISDEDEFRIRANGTWNNQFGLPTDVENLVSINEMAILTKDEGGNTQTMRPTEAGVYDLYFNPERPELWIMATGYKPGETPEVEPTPIGEIDTADKKYKVRATVVYSLPSICILDDGTGLIPYMTSPGCPPVGTEIELYGYVILIDQILYFSDEDSIEVISEGNPVNYHPEQMDSELIAELLDGDRCREVTFTAQYDALTNSYWVDGQEITFMWTWDLDWEIPQQEVEVTGYYVGKFATDQGCQFRVLPREVTAVEEPLTSISAITETDAIYTVEGTVTAAQERAYILADKTGAILVYGADHGRSIGDRIRITAKASVYDHMIQLNTADAVVELLSTGNSWNYNPTVMDGSQLDELIGTTVCREIQFSGDLYLSGPYAEMTVEGATVTPSLSYCDNSQYTLGYNEIKGYYIGYTDRYLKVLTYSSDTGEINPEHCKIYYTTADDYALNISDTDATTGTNLFGAKLLSDVYNNGQGVLTFDGPVTSIGDFAFYLCGTMTSIVIPESVTSIGRFAFMDCTNLPTVTIPESVVSIGEGAFSRCDNLAEFKSSFASSDGRCLIVEKTLNSFAPKEMTQYTVPEGIVKIGNSAFENCTLMEQIHLPQSVTEIDDDAFAYCTSLIALDIPDKVTRIGDNALNSCGMIKTLTLPETLESIGVQAFTGCAWLESVYCYATEPPVATSSYTGSTIVGQGEWRAFQFVPATAKIYVPAASVSAYIAAAGWKDYAGMIYAMTNPEDTIIYYTTSDGSIVKPSDTSSFGVNIVSNTYENGQGVLTFDGEVTTIGDYAFFLCENLTSVTLPDCVTSIGSRAFCSCFLLERINLPNNIVSIADHAFFGCKGLTSVTLPENLTSLGEGAFGGCSGLTSFDGKFATADHSAVVVDGAFIAFAPACGATEYVVPDGVTIIGDNAFTSCNLTSVTLPEGVETIKDYAFDNCTKITTITIPASVSSIGHAAFSFCSKLAEVYCLPTTPPAGFISYDADEWYAFTGNAADRKIYVPAASLSAYKTATYWSDYADAIYPMDGAEEIPETWKIYYTSTDGNIVEPFDSEAFGANILSNTIEYDPYTMMAMGVITFDGPVTTIGENAFLGKETLATLTIPENVTRIAKSAFESCKYLIGIEIPENVTTIGEYAFSNCEALADLSLGSGLTSIGNSAFSGCLSLTSVRIPDSVTSIGNSAFNGCGNLLEITLSSNLELIDEFLLSACSALQQINIPDRVKEIGYQAFSNCMALSNVSFGSGLERIGGEAFRYCTSLTQVELPYGLTFVGNGAFSYCYTLHQVTMPESVTTLEPYAFDHCLALTGFSMPGKVTEVSSGLFYSCIKLQTVRLHDAITAIGDSAFYHCNSLTDITIPNSVTSLGNDTFNGCTSLRTVNIPNGVTAIGMDTFFGCEGITEITLPDQINSIGDDAFYGCKSLTEITIPASVASIGYSAFSSCELLTACYCLPTTPPAGASYMFDYNASERKIYVPAASLSAYKTATYWSDYADAIYPMDGESGGSAAPTISWRGYNIDNSYNYTDGMQLIMDVTAQGGIAEFTVDIDSDVLTQEELLVIGLGSHIDLVNPGSMEDPLKTLGFLTKEDVVGQSAITFDLTPFGEVIKNMSDHSFYTNFTYTVTDAEGQRVEKTLQLRFHAGSGTK